MRMILASAFDISGLIDNLDLIWTIVFWSILGLLLISFFIGLLRGWKSGTYRLIFLSILAVTLLALLGVFADLVGKIDLRSFTQNPISFTLNGVEVSANPGPVFETVRELTYKVLKDVLKIKGSVETLQNYAVALTASMIRLALIVVIGITVSSVGSLLCWILWHIAFKFIIPKPKRKPKLRWVSGIEEVVVTALCGVLMLAPLSAISNSTISNINPNSISSTNETVVMFKKVASTYNESILNKAFFAWTKGDGSRTLDAQFVEFLCQVDSETMSANIISDLANISYAAGKILDAASGGENANGELSGFAFAPINYAGHLLVETLTFAGNDGIGLVNGLASFASDLAIHSDQVVSYLGNDIQDQLVTKEKTPEAYLKKAARSYRALAQAEFLPTIVDPFFEAETPYPSYDDPYALLTSDYTLNCLLELKKDQESRSFYDGLIKGYIYDHGSHASLKTLAPLKEDGSADVKAMNDISYLDEAVTVVTFLNRANHIDADFTKQLIRYASEGGSSQSSSTVFSSLLPMAMRALADNSEALADALIGPRDEQGEPITGYRGLSSKGCLMDSGLINAAFPVLLEMAGNALSSATNSTVDISEVANALSDPNWEVLVKNNKRELGATLDVLLRLTQNPYAGNSSQEKVTYGQSIADTGKAFLRDFSKHPGVDLDPEKHLYDFDGKLGNSLMYAISGLDKSKALSALVPALAENAINNIDLFKGDNPLTFDFHPIDSQGNSILGIELAKILSIVAQAPHVFPIFLRGGTFSVNSISTAMMNHEQEFIKILDAFAGSKIANPVINGNKNVNMVRLFNSLFKGLEIESSLTENDLNDVALVNTYDGEDGNIVSYLSGNIVAGKETEDYYLINAVAGVMNSGVLNALQTITNTNEILANLGEANMEGIFSSLGGSVILRKVMPAYLDAKVLDGMLNSAGDVSLKKMGVSFTNLTTKQQWASEGARFQSMIDLITKGIDLSDFDLFKDGVNLVDLMDTLCDSRMFMPLASSIENPDPRLVFTDESGTQYYYAFPSYFSQKILSAAGESNLYIFQDENPNGTTSEEKCSAFVSSCLDLNEPTKWKLNDAGTGELDHLKAIFIDLKALGSFDALSKLDDQSIPKMRSALKHMEESYCFSTVSVANALGNAMEKVGGSGDIDFSAAHTAYFYDTNRGEGYNREATVTEKKGQIDHLMGVMSILYDPQYGFAKGGKIDLSSISLGKLSTEYFLRPFLENSFESEVLHSRDEAFLATIEATVFEQIMGSLAVNSSIYGMDTSRFNWKSPLSLMEDTSHKNLGYQSTSSIFSIIKSTSDAEWPSEIDDLCDLIDFLQKSEFINDKGDFSAAALNDISSYFGLDPEIKEQKKESLNTMMSGVNNVELFRRALPRYLQNAINDGKFSGSLGNDLKCTDFYYHVKHYGSDMDYGPYPQSEIDSLITIFSELGGSTDIDMNDTRSLDGEALSKALAEMEHTGSFNGNKEKAASIFASGDPHVGHTAFANILADVLNADALKDYFFYASSPKDQHHVSSGDYSSSLTKAIYMVDTYCANNYSEAPKGGEKIAELGRFINFIASEEMAIYMGSSGTSFDQMDGVTLGDLLHALNQTTFYRDCVPAALDKSINADGTYNIDGIDLSLTNLYFSYYWVNEDGSIKTAASTEPNYEVPFYDPEIDQLSYIIGTLKDNKDSMSSFDVSSFDPMVLRNLLREMVDSYCFHEAGVNLSSPSYKTTWFRFDDSYQFVASGNVDLRRNDLTVFEQFVQKIYLDSKLYEKNFSLSSSEADLALYLEAAKGTSGSYGIGLGSDEESIIASASKIKLHNNIVAFNEHTLTDVKNALITTRWGDEIDALTTDGHPHTPRIDQSEPDDSFVGLIEIIQKLGIASSGTIELGNSNLNGYEPNELYYLFNSINDLAIVNEVLPNSFAGFISGKGSSSDGFGLDKYSKDEVSYGSGAISSIAYNVNDYGLANTLSFTYSGADLSDASLGLLRVNYGGEDVTSLTSISKDGSVYTLNVEKIPGSFTVSAESGETFDDVKVTFDRADYRQDQKTYELFGIRSLYYFFASTFRGMKVGDSYYYSFDSDSELGEFLEENPTDTPEKTKFQHSTFGLLNLVIGSGLYEREFLNASDSYRAKDYFLYNLLTVNANVAYIGDFKYSFVSDFGTFGLQDVYDSAVGLNQLTEVLKNADPEIEIANEKRFCFEQAAYLDQFCSDLGFAGAFAENVYYRNYLGQRPAAYASTSPTDFMMLVEEGTIATDATGYSHIVGFTKTHDSFVGSEYQIHLYGTKEGAANTNFVTSSDPINEPGEMIKGIESGIVKKFAYGYANAVNETNRNYKVPTFSPTISSTTYYMDASRSAYIAPVSDELDYLGTYDEAFSPDSGYSVLGALNRIWTFLEESSRSGSGLDKEALADAIANFEGASTRASELVNRFYLGEGYDRLSRTNSSYIPNFFDNNNVYFDFVGNHNIAAGTGDLPFSYTGLANIVRSHL